MTVNALVPAQNTSFILAAFLTLLAKGTFFGLFRNVGIPE